MARANEPNPHNYVAFQPPQIRAPQRLRGHFIYVIMYEMVLLAALWQHAEPVYTLSLLVLTPLLGFSAYIPYKWLSHNKRFYCLQLGVTTLCFFWFVFRLYQNIPLDKVLAEALCCIGMCFVLAQRTEDYDYLLLISFFMLLYGSLIPRSIYIHIYLPTFALMMILFYSTRARSIGRQASLKMPFKSLFRSWFFMAAHLIITALIAWYVFILFPLEKKPGEGVFQVSFHTENEMMNHADSATWIKTSRINIKPDAKKSTIADGEKATEVTENPKAPKSPNVSSKKPSSSKGQGKGSAATASEPSTDLVFRVKSPLKLYWAARYYDAYNGREWQANSYITAKKNMPDGIASEVITQQFIIEKWVSYHLFAAYQCRNFDLNRVQNQGYIFEIGSNSAELLQVDFPRTPFRYTVSSQVYVPFKRGIFSAAPPSYWPENVGRPHYQRLPNNLISKRLKDKTAELVKGVRDPYERAVKLRDYLRNSFPYKQFADPLPESKEMADYFVFELKTGHCEYYASALAVMARLAELPSRVVTGFSPGNYNALTGYFEVHEYHAHAWTQIFIEGMGWLTFDATPPSAVPSRTTPFGIGSFRDPFGDSWRVTPPEITKEAQKYVIETRAKRFASAGAMEELNPAEQMLLKSVEVPDNIREHVNNQFDKLLPNVPGKGLEKMRTIAANTRAFIKETAIELYGKLQGGLGWLKTNWFVAFPMLILAAALWIGSRIVRNFIHRIIHLHKERKYFSRAGKATVTADIIQYAYLSVREQLILMETPRRRNMELIRYGQQVEERIPEFKDQVVPIFRLYSKLSYGNQPMSIEEIATIRTCLENCRLAAYRLSGLGRYLK